MARECRQTTEGASGIAVYISLSNGSVGKVVLAHGSASLANERASPLGIFALKLEKMN